MQPLGSTKWLGGALVSILTGPEGPMQPRQH